MQLSLYVVVVGINPTQCSYFLIMIMTLHSHGLYSLSTVATDVAGRGIDIPNVTHVSFI